MQVIEMKGYGLVLVGLLVLLVAVSGCTDSQKGQDTADHKDSGSNGAALPLPSSGSGACVESWACTGWSPSVCDERKIQTRVCADANNCGTTDSMPSETRACSIAAAPDSGGGVGGSDGGDGEAPSSSGGSYVPEELYTVYVEGENDICDENNWANCCSFERNSLPYC